MTMPTRTLYLAAPRGFCAGVDRAIDIVEMALQVYGAPIYVRHEIVHNRHVVETCASKGAVFVDELSEVPDGRGRDLLRARRVAGGAAGGARRADLRALDATCPLVTKVHLEALRYAKEGYTIVLVGHREHVEVMGTLGEAPESIVLVETAPRRRAARAARSRASPTSPRPRCRWTTCARSSTRSAAASRGSASRPRTTSATPPRTGRTR